MEYRTKRMNYFDRQFLREQDFRDEQDYHINRRRLLNAWLHNSGVVDGLEVKLDNDRVTVCHGWAIDSEGREILFPEDETLQVKDSMVICISYKETLTDKSQDPGITGFTRVDESGELQLLTDEPDSDSTDLVPLARVECDADGNLLVKDLRQKIIPKIPDYSISEVKFDTATRGKLVATGDDHDHLEGRGAKLKHSSLEKDNGTNPHQTTAADVRAVSTDGDTMHGRLTIEGGEEADASLAEGGLLVIGELTGRNIAIDNNEIMARDNKQASRLCLQAEGGELMIHYPSPSDDNVFVVGDDGNVGIGTSQPGGKLEIARPEPPSGYSTKLDGNQIIFNRSSNGDSYIQKEDTGRIHFVMGSGSTPPTLTIQRGDRVGIGMRMPSAQLHVSTAGLSDTDNGFRMGGNGQFAIDAPGVIGGRLTVLKNGNVGIGTTKPGQDKLDVRGRCYSSGGWQSNDADYAEYFESDDGDAIPDGMSVTLVGNGKIRLAEQGEIPIGVICAKSAVVGDSHREWPKKHLRDEFGRLTMEEYQEEVMVPKKEKVKKERQKVKRKTIEEEVTSTKIVHKGRKYCQVETTETTKREVEEPVFREVNLYDASGKNVIGEHRIPVLETYEEEVEVLDENGEPVMVGSGEFVTKQRPKLNPEYDESQEYISREDRPEWSCVGLLGKIPLCKGQPVADDWIKLKDISDEVELWLIK